MYSIHSTCLCGSYMYYYLKSDLIMFTQIWLLSTKSISVAIPPID